MFGGTTFLGQYFQVAQGYSPTKAGLMTIPLMVAAMLSSTIAGQIISRTGRWKAFLVGGGAFLVAGLAGLSLLRHDTPAWESGVSMARDGPRHGRPHAEPRPRRPEHRRRPRHRRGLRCVSFFRSLGGAVGVSALGAVLANLVQSQVHDGLVALGPAVTAAAGSGESGTLDLKSMPPVIATIVRTAYGDATGHIFLVAAAVAVVALVAVVFIREVPLRTTVALERPENVMAERG